MAAFCHHWPGDWIRRLQAQSKGTLLFIRPLSSESKGQTFVQDSLATGSFPPAFLSALGAFVVHQFFEGVIAEKLSKAGCMHACATVVNLYRTTAVTSLASDRFDCHAVTR
eukprot:18283-Heterococcus_DN1.PRE.6